jgi:small subunit ribosomal protein S9
MAKQRQEEFLGTGRRKTAVASLRLRKGSGQITVNDKPFDHYFVNKVHRYSILLPLEKLQLENKYDLLIRVKGGGISGQADAVSLALARSLVKEVEERRHDLKASGFLRRDPRKKERKKYGLAKARKAYQFSKR